MFCRMEVLSKYCSNPGYRQMCCKSCKDGNYTAEFNLTRPWTFTTVVPPITSITIHTTLNPKTPLTIIPSVSNVDPTPWSYKTTLTPSTNKSPIPTTDAHSPSTAQYEEDTSVPYYETWSETSTVHIVEYISSSTKPWPSTPQYTSAHEDLDTILTTTPQPRMSATSPPAIIRLQKENNSIDVSYRIINPNEVALNHLATYPERKRVPFSEKTQNKRIQELLAEKRKDLLLHRLKRKPGD